MMVPFDGTGGGPPQGHPSGMAPQPMSMPMGGMPPGVVHGQGGPSGMPQGMGGHNIAAMGGGPYGHRNSLGMGGPHSQGPPYMPPQSPARQGSFTGSMGPGNPLGPPPHPPPHHGGYMGGMGGMSSSVGAGGGGHPPLHSPHQHQPPPPHAQQRQPPPPHQQHMQQHHHMQPPPHSHHQQMQPPPPHSNFGPGHHSSSSSSVRQGMPLGMGSMSGGHDMMGSSSQGSHTSRQQQHHYNMGGGGVGGGGNAAASTGGGGVDGGGGGGLSGSWQSDRDTPHRRDMIQQIVKLLKKDKGGSPESMAKLPQMAKQLEVSLYRNASSFEAYRDMTTLKKRLQLIAAEVQRKTRGVDQDPRSSRGYPSDPSGRPQQQQQPPPPPPQQQMQVQQQQQQQMGRMDGSSPYMGNSSARGMMDEMSMSNSMRSQQPQQQYGNSRPIQQDSRLSMNSRQQQPLTMQPQPPASSNNNRGDPEWKMRIKHKQQRLLLLHHSAKCPHEDGTCPVTQHCADMKRLWRHMEGCKDNACRVPHCFSSRAILSHYRKCKDPSCPACGPVRQTVRKSKATSQPPPPPPQMPQQQQQSGVGGMMNNSMNSMSRMSSQPPLHAAPGQQPPHSMMQQQQPDNMLGQSGSFQSTSSMNSVGASSFQQAPQLPQRGGPSMTMPPQMGNSGGGRRQSFPPPQQPMQQQQMQQQQPMQQQPPPQQMQQQPHPQSNSTNGGSTSPVASFQSPYRPGSNQPSSPDSHTEFGSMARMDSVTLPPPPRGGPGSGGSSRDSSEWQKIRHKQQRLLLLRHASRCQHEAGKCPVTPHCASMKKLWEHIAHCKNQQCQVQHCLSSRYVLSHYRRCKDNNCPACGPVRETIRKSHEREQKRKIPQPSSSVMPGMMSSTPDPSPMASSLDGGFDDRPSPSIDFHQPEPKRPKYEEPPPPQPQHLPPPSPEEEQSEQLLPQQPLPSSSSLETPPPEPSIPSSEPMQPAVPNVTSSVESSDLVDAQQEQQHQSLERVEPSAPISNASSKLGVDTSKDSKAAADLSLLQSFTVKQLKTHLASLDRKTQLPPAKLKAKCLEVLKGLQTHQHGWVFNCPVDPVELGLPDYFDIIKKPMDLGTIQKKLENGTYHAIEDFQTDVCLTFDNAMTYNEDGSVVFDMAKELRAKFEVDQKKLMAQLEAEDLQRRQNERACTLCGCEKLLFEPPVYFCNGMNCQNQRIRRNSHFYIGGNNQYFWCSTCFNELDEKIPIELIDMTIMKTDLKKKKNDEVHEESWVQCDTCQRWVHQICGLFNGRQNTQQHSEYCCPRCLCAKLESGKTAPTPRPPGAADLPRTMLSEWLEKHIMKRVERKKRQLAEEKANSEGISLEEATILMASGPIYVRQVTSMDRKLEVRDLMKKRYAHKNYPDEFPFRCKCIVVFQEIEGVDTVLFALYLYEHGEDNPPPNQRVVYISYLDSVHFMRPRKIRTFVYHEILIAYLDYARRRGFSTVHIWACPPLKGDDYIFYAKPEDQKTPRDARLRQWYIDMLIECQKRNIVGKLTNMYDLYFANESLDATAVPYMEGDYFPGEAENIIKMIEEGGGKKGGGGGKKKKSKSSSKSKGGTGTRSSGVDEMSLIESGCYGGVKSFKDLDRDQVMVKLGETIMPMKDSFIVAFLNWSGAKEEDMVVPPEIEKARIEYASRGEIDDITGSKRDALGNPRDALSLIDKDGQPIKVIDDDDEDLDCEFLNNRQAFLNLCRGNHYQFDELRRSKHTSMMVLWHLHNRDAPKFVQQCVVCSREILSGTRYHCNTCPDYDLCQECFKSPSTNRGACNHTLQPIAVDAEAAQERNGLTDEERMQRQRNLMLHIQLIEHAARCTSKTCTSSNCVKMKNYLNHSRTCRIKAGGGCKICKRIWTLLRIHAQKCKDRNCPIPQCIAIREKMRQLQKQQQAMDDRRRLEMNRHMRFSITGAPSSSSGISQG